MDRFAAADKKGQAKLVDQLNKIFSGQTITIDQHYIDKETVDIYMTATTKSNISYFYVFETKDRKFDHNKYGDCMLDVKKYEELIKRKGKYKPMYVHTFQDDWLSIWDISKIDISKYEPKTISRKRYTVVNSDKIDRKSYLIPRSECVYDKSFVL